MTAKENDSEQTANQQEQTTQEPGNEASPEEMGRLLEDARAKVDEHFNQLVRTQAELENLRKRTTRELENAHKYALEKFASELLPVRDSLELGVNAASGENVDPAKLLEGMELTLKMLNDLMEKFEIRVVNPEGEKFNPELHQALSMQNLPDVEPNTVVTVVQKGYQLNDRLIRPALVVVSTGGQKKDEKPEGTEEYDGSNGPDTPGARIDEQA